MSLPEEKAASSGISEFLSVLSIAPLRQSVACSLILSAIKVLSPFLLLTPKQAMYRECRGLGSVYTTVKKCTGRSRISVQDMVI